MQEAALDGNYGSSFSVRRPKLGTRLCIAIAYYKILAEPIT